MSNLESMKQDLAKAPTNKGLEEIIRNAAKDFGQVLPNHMKPERIVRIATTCIRKNPKLAQCEPASLLGSLMTSAQLGIEPIAGRAYLIPFQNNRKRPDGSGWQSVLEAEFVLGYKGVVELFYRHSKAGKLDWAVVHKNDEFSYEYGTDAYLKHRRTPGIAVLRSGSGFVRRFPEARRSLNTPRLRSLWNTAGSTPRRSTRRLGSSMATRRGPPNPKRCA
jgi:recombination protein RecT